MQKVISGDGRVLAVEEWGEPDGTPVLYVCGSPMSRLARYPDPDLFGRLGIRLITYDRPGFGYSTPQPGRRVVDAADDIAAIADTLGLTRFPIFGVSGGGPHALAFTARYPDRVVRVATLAGLAPRDADGLDWTAGMGAGNRASAAEAIRGVEALTAHLGKSASASAPSLLPANDQAILARPEIGEMVRTAFAEAIRPGIAGWVDDTRALFGLPWGFDPSTISRQVRLWHGELDEAVPVGHGRWLAARIPGATLATRADVGHAGHFDATPAMLEWLVRAD
ncbi:alpha/beta fold hydrolase [Plantactinospora soyae]|uniref:Pimeloyl-ACP methyl ester carboxylesterase n=1 Tax=Plantactinospora soyae TaxID=1544732 RepID=A0A927M4E9_9ACTN|nr:alpha/beta hydrolase [Plantactinospora soyae]MBE1486747.1 pimeloyl-ACP methyl ester carboxylesterase [Plantactinospora soyae]